MFLQFIVFCVECKNNVKLKCKQANKNKNMYSCYFNSFIVMVGAKHTKIIRSVHRPYYKL